MQSLTNRQIDGIDRRVGKLDKKHLVIAVIAPEFYCHLVPFWLVVVRVMGCRVYNWGMHSKAML
jgi:hypothetical protein